ncbi:MAG: hypothetical protein U0167_07610 [bacterium]
MSSSQHEDYLLREIRAVAVMLARILGLRTSGRLEEARVELEKAYDHLLGPRVELFRKLDSRTAADLVDSPDRTLSLARLVHEEAAQEADAARRSELRMRAVRTALEAARRRPGSAEIREFLTEAAAGIDDRRLTPAERASLEEILVRPKRGSV